MHITTGERLFLYRKRQEITQREAAEFWNLGLGEYLRKERGDEALTKEMKRLLPKKPKDHERCLLMRKRAGKTQADVAKDMNFCRRWIMLMEKGRVPCDDLIWYWEA